MEIWVNGFQGPTPADHLLVVTHPGSQNGEDPRPPNPGSSSWALGSSKWLATRCSSWGSQANFSSAMLGTSKKSSDSESSHADYAEKDAAVSGCDRRTACRWRQGGVGVGVAPFCFCFRLDPPNGKGLLLASLKTSPKRVPSKKGATPMCQRWKCTRTHFQEEPRLGGRVHLQTCLRNKTSRKAVQPV